MWTRKSKVIAQSDDNDYQESGWIAVVDGKKAALGNYSHCSCYGTWTALGGGGLSSSGGDPIFEWEGSVTELIHMAKRKADPCVPSREANPEDYDYDHLMDVYQQILTWDKKGRP